MIAAAAAAIATPSVQLGAILPTVILTTGALLLLIVGSFEHRSARVTSGMIGLLSFTGAGLATWHLWNNGNGTAFSGQLATDRYAALVQAIVCASGLATVLLGWGTRRISDRIAEYYALLCFAGAGHVHPGSRQRLRVAVRRPRAVLDLPVRPVRPRRRQRGVARERPQVPDHRLRRVGRAAVRQRPRLHRHGLAALRRDRQSAHRGRARTPASCSPASRSSSRGSRSRRRRRRSTCGLPTSTRARPPPSWRSWRPRPRRSRWRRCCG